MEKIANIRKREILESFYQVMKTVGLEGSSIPKIAKKMGAHPKLISYYFNSKDELISELVEYILENFETSFRDRLDKVQDHAKRLDSILDAIFGFEWALLIDNSVYYACYYLSWKDAKIKDSFKKMFGFLKEFLIIEIDKGIKGGFIPETDSGKIADLIIALLEGYTLCWHLRDEDSPDLELAEYFKEIVLKAMKCEK